MDIRWQTMANIKQGSPGSTGTLSQNSRINWTRNWNMKWTQDSCRDHLGPMSTQPTSVQCSCSRRRGHDSSIRTDETLVRFLIVMHCRLMPKRRGKKRPSRLLAVFPRGSMYPMIRDLGIG